MQWPPLTHPQTQSFNPDWLIGTPLWAQLHLPPRVPSPTEGLPGSAWIEPVPLTLLVDIRSPWTPPPPALLPTTLSRSLAPHRTSVPSALSPCPSYGPLLDSPTPRPPLHPGSPHALLILPRLAQAHGPLRPTAPFRMSSAPLLLWNCHHGSAQLSSSSLPVSTMQQ